MLSLLSRTEVMLSVAKLLWSIGIVSRYLRYLAYLFLATAIGE